MSSSVRAATLKLQPPKILRHADVTAEATGPNGAIVKYRPAKVRGAASVAYSKRSGTRFRLGTTIVRITARNAAGTAHAKFKVRVVDTKAPTIAATADVTAEATGPTGATVAYTPPSAKDVVDGDVAPSCSPAAGSVFALGSTSVTCTAQDRAGNQASATFNVKVADTTPPAIALHPDVTATATSTSGAPVSYTLPTVTDAVDKAVVVSCTPASGATFPIGTTTVTCTARDASGNTATSTFRVTVTPPPATPGVYAGTTSQGRSVVISVANDGRRILTFSISVSDSCSPDGTLTGTSTLTNIAIAPDGSFSATISFPFSGSGVAGTATDTVAGRFTSSTSVNGTFREVATLTSPSGYTCDSGQLTWSATRGSAVASGLSRAREGVYARLADT